MVHLARRPTLGSQANRVLLLGAVYFLFGAGTCGISLNVFMKSDMSCGPGFLLEVIDWVSTKDNEPPSVTIRY